jgi:3'(2'), 5'-bisphosphate nucleotidase
MVTTDHALAGDLATEAGELLLAVRRELAAAPTEMLKDEGDRRSHELLMARLAELRPGDAVLSEEGADDLVRLRADRTWIVDPLDGTREFSEPPRTDWAVHVALWQDGELVAGAVALPALGITLTTDPAPPRPGPVDGPIRIIASRTRPGEAAAAVEAALGGKMLFMGSAGAKAMAVVRGEADVYAHTGGQYEWDSAAPVAVARAAGLHASRIDGSPLLYNQANPYLPDLLICRPELAEACLEALKP